MNITYVKALDKESVDHIDKNDVKAEQIDLGFSFDETNPGNTLDNKDLLHAATQPTFSFDEINIPQLPAEARQNVTVNYYPPAIMPPPPPATKNKTTQLVNSSFIDLNAKIFNIMRSLSHILYTFWNSLRFFGCEDEEINLNIDSVNPFSIISRRTLELSNGYFIFGFAPYFNNSFIIAVSPMEIA